MNARTVCVESANLRAIATVNGRARCPVFLYDIAAPEKPLVSESLNVASSKERAKFLGLLGDAHPHLDAIGEVAPLLERLAAEAAASVLPGGAPAPAANLDVEPWGESVHGAELLDSLAAHVCRYVHLPSVAADAVTAWVVLTHCIEWLMFAPLLVLASPTKRSGKTLLLSLLAPVVRRGRLTSPTSISAAVLFRLNEREQPVFLLDEAERLQSRHAAPELVELINNGHRRGARAYRCVERSGKFDIEDFDVFGFRALALIGKPWDTLADRSVLISMERKPRTARVARFRESTVERIGRDIARQARRWTTDARTELQAAYDAAPRPLWLGDRDCDNWAGLFAVASVAGGSWPERIEAAARLLAGSREDDLDAGERLLHDTRATVSAMGDSPPVIQSGELLQLLNAIETSQWGDARDGRGLSTHGLAARFKPFGIRPRAGRHPSTGAMVRGYWLADFADAFQRYPAPETVETVWAGKRPPTTTQGTEPAPHDVSENIGAALPAQTVSVFQDAEASPPASAVLL